MAAGALAIVMIAWLAASAQERRAPWPPRPVAPPEEGTSAPSPSLHSLPSGDPIQQTQHGENKAATLPKIIQTKPGAGVIVLPDPDTVLPAGGVPKRPEMAPRRLPVETSAPPLNVDPKQADVRDDPAKTIESLLQAIQDRKAPEPPKANPSTPTIPDLPPIQDVKPPILDSKPTAIEPKPPMLDPAPMPPVPPVVRDVPPAPKLDPLPPVLAPLPMTPKVETKTEPKVEPRLETKIEPKADRFEGTRQANKPLPLPPFPLLPGLSGKAENPTTEATGAKPEPKPETRPEPGRFVLVKPVRRHEPAPDLFDPSRSGNDKFAPPAVELDPDASVTPQLTVEKRGPFAQKLGPALAYQILVRNVGQTPANNVRVEDEIPGSIKLTDCDPRPDTYEGDKAIWKIPSLRPGEERIIQLKLQSDRPGEMASTTAVHVFASTSFRTKILPGEKGEKGNAALDDEGPNLFPPTPKADLNRTSFDPSRSYSVDAKSVSVKMGGTANIEVVIQNRTTLPIDGLQMYAKIPAGLKHPRGNEIFADLPPLKPGESRLFKIPLATFVAGSHAVEIRIVGKAGEATATSTVNVASTTAMTITQPAITRLALNREGEVLIQVTNHQEKNLRNIELLDRLPDNLEFVGASDRGLYQQATRTVHWLIDSLPAGQTRTVSLKVQPKTPGQFPHEVVARAMHLPEQKSAGTLEVEGYANLTLKIRDREDPVELGKDAVYDIVLENRGSTAASNVRITVLTDDGMQPRSATGPLAFQVQGRTIAFAPIPRLAAGATTTLQVMTTASQVGDRRVRVQVTSDQQTTPVWREESTAAYRE
ncbi:MAG: DUF11 domain-containing protein [Gemmataceae bacterium]|nr:DUF11 domain-containing protein [Gemmataceae bacterium]